MNPNYPQAGSRLIAPETWSKDMAASFRQMRSNSPIWHYLIHGWLYGERPPLIAPSLASISGYPMLADAPGPYVLEQ